MKSMATSDHGFPLLPSTWRQAKAHDIKPIIGVGASTATHRTDRSRVRWATAPVTTCPVVATPMTGAETTEGMHTCSGASSIASLEGQLYKPRMDREVLQTYSKGLIATTGCPPARSRTRLRLGQFDEAIPGGERLPRYLRQGQLRLEVMGHGLDIERNVQEDLHRLAKQLNLPYVATNDLHYTRQEDHTATRRCCACSPARPSPTPSASSSTRITSTCARLKKCTPCSATFPAMQNTLEIAERCNVEFNTRRTTCRTSPCPEGENEESWFVKEVEKGLHYRFPQGVPDNVRKQAEYEVGGYYLHGLPRLLPRGRRLYQLG